MSRYLREQLGGRLDIHKNAAFLMLEEPDCFGSVHPRDAMLPEAALLICQRIQELLQEGALKKEDDETLLLSRGELEALCMEVRERWRTGWSKEYREMEPEKYLKTVTEYMKGWMLLREEGEFSRILPSAGKLSGVYSADFNGGEEE